MHTGQTYKLRELLLWTRRNIYWLLLTAIIPTILYEGFGLKWLTLPFAVVALLGTATAFMVGFKNASTYGRTWEARQIWGAAMGASKSWAILCRDLIDDSRSRELVYRHLGWMTALRYQLRAERSWEASNKSYFKEYMQYYSIPEKETPLKEELARYISKGELEMVLSKKNPAYQLLSLQGSALTKLYNDGSLEHFNYLTLHGALREFCEHQGKSERIKNFPYPRQYATINSLLVKLFCILLPFALLGEFNELNDEVTGMLKGHMVWFVIPFSLLLSWIYTSLDQIGESTENPFEGSANDVPISQLSRATEIDIREMLGEREIPEALQPKNNIVL